MSLTFSNARGHCISFSQVLNVAMELITLGLHKEVKCTLLLSIFLISAHHGIVADDIRLQGIVSHTRKKPKGTLSVSILLTNASRGTVADDTRRQIFVWHTHKKAKCKM